MTVNPTTDRLALARRRVLNILRTYTAVNHRTLENKISDAGPNQQRINPHVIGEALEDLRTDNTILRLERATGHWFTLPGFDPEAVTRRISELEAIHRPITAASLRIGQALEIAVCRAILEAKEHLDLLGGFLDLDDHDDSTPYRKEEPPRMWRGARFLAGRLDFVVVDRASSVAGGLEVKNVRQWLYPSHDEVRSLLTKCCALDLVPILVARRVHYITTRLLIPRGGIVHETYNQRFPFADATLAAQAANKDLLGFHDIRIGNQPDQRLRTFIKQLPGLLKQAQARFESGGKQELGEFAAGQRTLGSLGLSL